MVAPLPFLEDLLGQAYAVAVTQFLYFVVSFVVVYLLGRTFVIPVVSRMLRARNLDAHARRPLLKLAWFGVLFVAIAVAFGFADYGDFLQSLATIAAAATLAVGFAMQNVLQNLAAGLFIYTDRPFRIGDWIEWDDQSGVVDDISLRVTRVKTFDNELLTVPNSVLTDGVIKNPVAEDELRLQVPFGVAYDADVGRATELLVEEAEKHDEILDDPAPSVRLTELGDSAIVLTSRIWIANPRRSDFVKTKADYTATVVERFEEAGIDIPYPHRTLTGGIEIDGRELPPEAVGEPSE